MHNIDMLTYRNYSAPEARRKVSQVDETSPTELDSLYGYIPKPPSVWKKIVQFTMGLFFSYPKILLSVLPNSKLYDSDEIEFWMADVQHQIAIMRAIEIETQIETQKNTKIAAIRDVTANMDSESGRIDATFSGLSKEILTTWNEIVQKIDTSFEKPVKLPTQMSVRINPEVHFSNQIDKIFCSINVSIPEIKERIQNLRKREFGFNKNAPEKQPLASFSKRTKEASEIRVDNLIERAYRSSGFSSLSPAIQATIGSKPKKKHKVLYVEEQ